MTLDDIKKQLDDFNEAREWGQFHSPRNMAMALSVEAAELLECFLWTADGAPIPPDKKRHIAEEAADVLICLTNFCSSAGIDLTAAFKDKLAKNNAKYPVEKSKGSSAKYDEL